MIRSCVEEIADSDIKGAIEIDINKYGVYTDYAVSLIVNKV